MEEMEQEIVRASMQIILYAGDAREANLKAIKEIEQGNFSEAWKELAQAEEHITVAHKVQTDKIQDETRGEKGEYSLLFAHAQDTLMTINSEIILTKSLMHVFQMYEKRIVNLEAACCKTS